MADVDNRKRSGGAADSADLERIRTVAGDLYVLRGHDGFSFGDIADTIGTTRANIHHHFGSKGRLMEELIKQFATDAVTRIAHHWAEATRAFSID